MLSLFPHLLDYNQAAPLIIRVTLGAVLLHWAYRGLKNSSAPARAKAIGLIEVIVGLLLIIGLWTQAAALVAGICLVILLIGRIRNKTFLTDGVNYYLLLLIMALSLLATGAGWFAFDLAI